MQSGRSQFNKGKSPLKLHLNKIKRNKAQSKITKVHIPKRLVEVLKVKVLSSHKNCWIPT